MSLGQPLVRRRCLSAVLCALLLGAIGADAAEPGLMLRDLRNLAQPRTVGLVSLGSSG